MIRTDRIIRNKNELLSLIWQDWKLHANHPEESFIFQYLEEENSLKAEGIMDKIGDYIPNKRGRKKNGGRIPFCQVLEGIGKAYRTGKADASKALDYLKRLICSNAKASGDPGMQAVLRDIDACWNEKDKEKLAAEIFATDNARIAGFKNKLIRQQVSSFFNPYGFRSDRKKTEDKLPGEEDERNSAEDIGPEMHSSGSPAYGDDIRLFTEYLRYASTKDSSGIIQNPAGADTLNSRYREECIALYNWLNALPDGGDFARKNNSFSGKGAALLRPGKVRIPIIFHPATGAGIYIIGIHRLTRFALDRYRKKHNENFLYEQRNCYFAVISFFDDYAELSGEEETEGVVLESNFILFDRFEDAADYLYGENGRDFLWQYDELNNNAGLASADGYERFVNFFQHTGMEGLLPEEKKYEEDYLAKENEALRRTQENTKSERKDSGISAKKKYMAPGYHSKKKK